MENRVHFVITGGAGFIGSNFLRFMTNKYQQYFFTNIDSLTYSGRKENIYDLEERDNYKFIKEDICNKEAIEQIVSQDSIVVNFAAESHVDRSILDSKTFIKTNIIGTHVLLEAARKKQARLFIQISTDEVYGSLNIDQRPSKETDLLSPSSPYSASKAAAEMLCLSYIKTFGSRIIITRSSNNFGPYQFTEKLIPLFITNLLEEKRVPVYGNGKNIRDWIYIRDNCEAIDFVIHHGIIGEIYNIGGGKQLQNIELTQLLLKKMGYNNFFIEYVQDRLGHDLRYALDCSKIKSLGWEPKIEFEEALDKTINWYRENKLWWMPLKKQVRQ